MKTFHLAQLEGFSDQKENHVAMTPRRGGSMSLRDVATARCQHRSQFSGLRSGRLPGLFGVAFGSFVALLLLMGCGSTTGPSLLPIAANGPGTVFSSVEAAAFDALSYCYLQSRATHRPSHALGGSIYPVRGGFSYKEPMQAEKFTPDVVVYSLGPQDVAHFHTYPSHWSRTVNRARENLSKSDRAVVNSVDPMHRASFILTPRLKVKVYRSEDEGTEFLAKLGGLSETRTIAFALAPASVQSGPPSEPISLNSEEASPRQTNFSPNQPEDLDDPG
jgi:hypothetical protein